MSVAEKLRTQRNITRKRIYVATMQSILQNMDKIIVDQKGGQGVVPYLPLDQLMKQRGTAPPSWRTRMCLTEFC